MITQYSSGPHSPGSSSSLLVDLSSIDRWKGAGDATPKPKGDSGPLNEDLRNACGDRVMLCGVNPLTLIPSSREKIRENLIMLFCRETVYNLWILRQFSIKIDIDFEHHRIDGQVL